MLRLQFEEVIEVKLWGSGYTESMEGSVLLAVSWRTVTLTIGAMMQVEYSHRWSGR